MYLEKFGLQEKPFHITPNPRFIFLSKMHKEAFAHLLYGVKERVGFLSFIGEVGTGKTTVLRTLLKQLEQANYHVALIFNPCLTALELLQSVHREFGIPFVDGESNIASLHDSLNCFLLEERQQGKTVVLVIDEAQNLDPTVLEQLRMLSNLETETDKLLQLIIVGQPELDEVLGRHELRQLKQRLTVRYRLTNMDAEDTFAYIYHRLKVAGYKGTDLFSAKAIKQVYRLTNGYPRLINILCDRALLVAYSNGSDRVDYKTVSTAQAELAGEKNSWPIRWPMLAAIGAGGTLLILLAILQPGALGDYFNSKKAVVTPIVATPVMKKRVEKPEPTIVTLDKHRLDQIKKEITILTEVESARLASIAVLGYWGQPISDKFSPERYRSLDRGFQDSRMGLIGFQDSPEKLFQLNTPAILSILFPNLNGKRYLALLKFKDGLVLTEPALSENGWFPIEYLKEIWFGKAVIPWRNYDKIAYVNTPGSASDDVTRIQGFLSHAGYPDLNITGVYDSETIVAVSDLQRRVGLNPDGRIGAQTLLQLYRLVGFDLPQLTGGGMQ